MRLILSREQPLGRLLRSLSLVAGLLFLQLGIGDHSEARFLLEDADQIDPEERYNTETWNDKISYRYPVSWEQLWNEYLTGYRVHAGSLNISRFDFSEDIKLTVADDQPAGFSFTQSRREDVVEQRRWQEVRAFFNTDSGLRWGIIGDGGTFKEFGDIGGFAGFGSRDRFYGEVYYWSVDHYYPTKKAAPDDRRPEMTYTVGGVFRLTGPGPLTGVVSAERDTPLVWERVSQGYTYKYQREKYDLNLMLDTGGGNSTRFSAAIEDKHESKDWSAGDAPEAMRKGLKRRTLEVEAEWTRHAGATSDTFGLGRIERNARYDQFAPAAIADEDLPEQLSPAASSRREWAAWLWHQMPTSSPKRFTQLGLVMNDVHIREDRFYDAFEVKAQAALDYRFTDKARCLLNTTWDIDQVTGDFPWRKEPFRPWGGGDIQFIAVF